MDKDTENLEQTMSVFEVEVAGCPLKLRSAHSEEMVKELIQLINEKTQEALGGAQQMSFQNALLLASLHIAEDYVLLKKNANRELDAIEAKAMEILSDLGGGPSLTRKKVQSENKKAMLGH